MRLILISAVLFSINNCVGSDKPQLRCNKKFYKCASDCSSICSKTIKKDYEFGKCFSICNKPCRKEYCEEIIKL